MTDTKTTNRENEAALIGACLRDNAAFTAVADSVSSVDFDWHSYGIIWDAMKNVHAAGMRIDQVTVGDELARMEKLHEILLHDTTQYTGRTALSVLRENGDPRSVESYARNVLDYSAKKQLEQLFTMGVGWSRNGRTSIDIITDIQSQLDRVHTFDNKTANHTQTLAEAVSEAYDRTGAAAEGKVLSVPTGYIDLDRMFSGGLSAGDLYILAARPGQGKTALAACIAYNAAQKNNRVAVFSLEMMNHQIAMRLIAMHSGVGFDKQKSGKMEDTDWPVYTNAVEELADGGRFPIVLNDMPSISVSRIRQELRRMKDIDLVIMDYIQLGGIDGKYDRRDLEVGEISRGLKAIAKEFEVPVLAAAQLSRAVEQRAEKKPVLSDLRESGSIENDADCVMFIYRPDQYEKDTVKQNTAEIIIAKHRNGPVGSVELIYRPYMTKFENATTRFFQPNDRKDIA